MDSPPLLAVTDAAILASGADGTLLVVASGFVSPREVLFAISQLNRGNNSSALGIVLNGLDIKKIYGSYYYYFHYQYHPYYDTEDKKERKRKRIAPADTAS